jgi:hypothetical protein
MHTFYWGDWHRDHTVGPELADNISPTGWCVQRGMKFTTHHDAPVAFPNSMRVLDATVTRRSRSGDIIGPAQRVDVMTALKAMTIWPAWQHFEEKDKGSIEVGKLADFVVLDGNPLEVDPETLDQLRVTETIKEDVTVFAMKAPEKAPKSSSHMHGDRANEVFSRALLAIRDADGWRDGGRVPSRSQLTIDPAAGPPCSTCVCGAISKLATAIAARHREGTEEEARERSIPD